MVRTFSNDFFESGNVVFERLKVWWRKRCKHVEILDKFALIGLTVFVFKPSPDALSRGSIVELSDLFGVDSFNEGTSCLFISRVPIIDSGLLCCTCICCASCKRGRPRFVAGDNVPDVGKFEETSALEGPCGVRKRIEFGKLDWFKRTWRIEFSCHRCVRCGLDP